jgi:hypothetical protein
MYAMAGVGPYIMVRVYNKGNMMSPQCVWNMCTIFCSLLVILYVAIIEPGSLLKLMSLLSIIMTIRGMVCNSLFCWKRIPTSAIILLYMTLISVVGSYIAYVALSAYRLGDFVRHMGCFKSRILRQMHVPFHPTSLVAQYGASRGPCDLLHLRSITEIDQVSRMECMMHVRTGEVVDNNRIPLDVFWQGTTENHNTSGQVQGDTAYLTNEPVLTRGYVLSKAYYEMAALWLKEKQIDTIHLCHGGLHTPGTTTEQSAEYIRRIVEVFHNVGIEVIDSSDMSADAAFIQMSNARVFIQSGGGYSKLIAELVSLRGGEVIG